MRRSGSIVPARRGDRGQVARRCRHYSRAITHSILGRRRAILTPDVAELRRSAVAVRVFALVRIGLDGRDTAARRRHDVNVERGPNRALRSSVLGPFGRVERGVASCVMRRRCRAGRDALSRSSVSGESGECDHRSGESYEDQGLHDDLLFEPIAPCDRIGRSCGRRASDRFGASPSQFRGRRP
jgi:hypothetical protein